MRPQGRQGIEEAVAAMVQGILDDGKSELTLDRVEFTREAGQWYLRVFLDHPEGVTLDHCQEVSRRLDDLLEAADPIPESYSLEVSSPGLERPLTREADYERFKDRLVTLRLYRSWRGLKTLTGRLGGLTPEGEILLETEPDGKVEIPRREVAKAHLAVDWGRVARRDGSGSRDSGGGGQ